MPFRLDEVDRPRAQTLAEIERGYIERVMAECDGRKVDAALILGINLSTLYRKMENYRVEARSQKEGNA